MSTSSNIIKQKTFWQQYGNLILILGGIVVGALIGAFAPSVGTAIKPVGDIFLNLVVHPSWFPWCSSPSPLLWAAWPT